jgi:uncharacterized protein (DUF924 family)
MPQMPEHHEVITFWFHDITPEHWFKKDDDFDADIKAKFEKTITHAMAGRLDSWADSDAGCLALIIVLDQFTRNIYRDTPRAFSGDEMALALSLRCDKRGYLKHPEANWRHFILMPMMHSEDIHIQDASLPLFREHTSERTYEFAVKHRDIIAQFGRFPHRNAILGRPSTDEEIDFLKQPGSSF